MNLKNIVLNEISQYPKRQILYAFTVLRSLGGKDSKWTGERGVQVSLQAVLWLLTTVRA